MQKGRAQGGVHVHVQSCQYMFGCMMTGISGRDVAFMAVKLSWATETMKESHLRKQNNAEMLPFIWKQHSNVWISFTGWTIAWVNACGLASKEINEGGTVMGGYCRPHSEEVDEVFCKQL